MKRLAMTGTIYRMQPLYPGGEVVTKVEVFNIDPDGKLSSGSVYIERDRFAPGLNPDPNLPPLQKMAFNLARG